MADRRRVNGPIGGTNPPIFDPALIPPDDITDLPRTRTRGPKELRKIFLQTNLTPSASGSAYLELSPSPSPHPPTSPSPSLKLTCTVHGARPLPRSAPFTPNLLLSTTVKFAPFASRIRRGYLRDAAERDLAVHLETALRGIIIAERWPKSGLEVVVTVLEGEEGVVGGEIGAGEVPVGMMSVLAGCITAASTAIVDAGIDCVDIVTGGVAALVVGGEQGLSEGRKVDAGTATQAQSVGRDDRTAGDKDEGVMLLDPYALEHHDVLAACVVAYAKARDEITMVWDRSRLPLVSQPGANEQPQVERLVEGAVQAAAATQKVVAQALQESTPAE